MVSCETDSLTSQRRQNSPKRLLPWAALAMVAAACLVCVALVNRQAETSSPEAAELMQMWNRPYVTTMLWNAAHDDAGSFNSDSYDDSSSDYTAFDTYGHSDGGTKLGGNIDADLKQILPSSELKGDGLSSHNSHEWDTSELADTNWGNHDSDSSWGDHNTGGSWLGTSQHSWDSAQSSQVKQELRKMYRKGVNHVPKKIAQDAEKQADSNFFGKWAKIAGKKVAKSGKKYGLSSAQAKLYKEAEKSEEKEDAKKAKYVSAVKSAAKKAKSSKKDDASTAKAKHEAHVKLKLKAADKVASHIATKADDKKAEAKKAVEKKKKAEAKEPAKDAGFIGDKNAIHKTLAKLQGAKDAKTKQAAEKRMAALEEQIKSDFRSVTSFAHKVKTSLPPLKLAKA